MLYILLVIYAFFIATPINLLVADLGRHIKNGEVLFQGNLSVLTQNLYSYTDPTFPFVNHHWLSGVLFYLTYSVFGFNGLSILFILVSVLTLFLCFDLIRKYSNQYIGLALFILFLPVLGYRTEVRPEAFSYLFCIIFFWILKNYSEGKISKKALFFLPLIEFIWINIHIYFFLGFVISFLFFLELCIKYLRKEEKFEKIKNMLIAGAVSSAALLLNPAGIRGVLYPLVIYQNYGYRVLEEQSVFFIQKLINIPVIPYFELAFAILVFSFIFTLRKPFKNFSVSNLLLAIFFSTIAWVQIRNFTIFGFFGLTIAAFNLKDIKITNKAVYYFGVGVLGLLILVLNSSFWESRQYGIGLVPEADKSANFFLDNQIKGPIFNNYDIGGYLIFNLYPKEKVFVDNRPEAYPSNFFKDTYIPMQESEDKWAIEDKKYQFNSIFFFRLDATPWGQQFLISKIKDPDWAPVFVDSYTIIFLKRNDQNKELIKKYELPKSMFGQSS